MSAILQGAGAATALSQFETTDSNKLVAAPSHSSLPVRSKKYISEMINSFGSSLIAHRSQPLIPNAVATKKTDNAATPSKSGHELLLFEALQEGLEEEMDRDPHVCMMGEDVGTLEIYIFLPSVLTLFIHWIFVLYLF